MISRRLFSIPLQNKFEYLCQWYSGNMCLLFWESLVSILSGGGIYISIILSRGSNLKNNDCVRRPHHESPGTVLAP